MKKILILCFIFVGCTPTPKDEYQTKYPDTPTMQSAEDAQNPDKIKL